MSGSSESAMDLSALAEELSATTQEMAGNASYISQNAKNVQQDARNIAEEWAASMEAFKAIRLVWEEMANMSWVRLLT